ncbi:hypothetical protein [Streptomyces sp. NBC_01363]|uniref:hypothetical protein n=1 Tax=Streptomyces sp. NBC_01363 TaxID=2903840 RepID=UPI00225BDF16|nr:hypothetical protein [Streptomyces sp. NBC_01363]MCX4734025.1 DUF1080 domain-containing protein [Streptomyces sp. NBC_01363]
MFSAPTGEWNGRSVAFCAAGGAARIVTLTVHRLRDVFRVTDTDPEPPPGPRGGAFRSGGVGDLTVVPAGHWTTTGAGRRGTPAGPCGGDLPLRIRARGGRIEAFVDGRQVIDVADTHHTRGRIGLNVFGGRAAHQDTFVTAL